MVHSPEWTTGSQLFRAFALISAPSQGASGPLSRVGHWLTTFQASGPVSALSLAASGPLSGVDHWLASFSQLPPPHATQKARARPGLSQFLKLLEAVLALGQTLLGRFLA